MQGLMEQMSGQLAQLFGPHVVRILGALSVLVAGWIVALTAGWLVRAALKRTTLDNRLARWIMGEDKAEGFDVERWAGKAVYYLILVFTLVGFFTALNLTVISEPLTAFLNQLFGYGPSLIGAGLLLGGAWIVATVLRRIVGGAMSRAKLDERLGGEAGIEEDKRPPLGKTVADAVYWLVFLLFLPAILEALSLEGLLEPVQGLVGRVLDFLPSILGAGAILGVGWFIARVVQRIVTNLLAAAGIDRVGERVGVATALGAKKLSGLLGLLVYILILIPVLISSLGALQLESITRPASQMLGKVMGSIPTIFAAGLLLTFAYIAGRLVSSLISNVLDGIGFNNVLTGLGLAKVGEKPGSERSPSALVGYLVLVAVMLFASVEAAGLLGFQSLAALLSSFVVVAGKVVLGLVIFGVGLYLASLAASTVQASGSAQAGLLAIASRASIIVLSGAIALRQMGLANEIIELAFGLLLGSIAVAVALAFGLGGRDLAARQIEGWLASMQSKKE
jgi:hypothetical protein